MSTVSTPDGPAALRVTEFNDDLPRLRRRLPIPVMTDGANPVCTLGVTLLRLDSVAPRRDHMDRLELLFASIRLADSGPINEHYHQPTDHAPLRLDLPINATGSPEGSESES